MSLLGNTELRKTYNGRRVLVTGHTGFKGGWLSLWLQRLGAHVTGYSLPPSTSPSLYELGNVGDVVENINGDIRDRSSFANAWHKADPDIVFHLAAQPLVRESYRSPIFTLETNVIGTAHALDIARESGQRLAMVIVTSDKCYENREWAHGYMEEDALGGYDVYSASKAAAELVISSYRRSFFEGEAHAETVALASARAGNVIGGGDWSPDRIVPDSIRALSRGDPINVRNPNSIRPWQHVLEPLLGYLVLGAQLLSVDQSARHGATGAWNFGPVADNSRTVRELVETLLCSWGSGEWHEVPEPQSVHEARMLHLSTDKARARLGWTPHWDFAETVGRTVQWYKGWNEGLAMHRFCMQQIDEHSGGDN